MILSAECIEHAPLHSSDIAINLFCRHFRPKKQGKLEDKEQGKPVALAPTDCTLAYLERATQGSDAVQLLVYNGVVAALHKGPPVLLLGGGSWLTKGRQASLFQGAVQLP